MQVKNLKDDMTARTVEENDNFYMYTYKIATCPRKYSHDWTSCPYAHSGESARRRDPRVYKPIPCPESKGGTPCPRGDSCKYAHNDFEYWLHPARYKTEFCKQGPGCNRKVCFFAHHPEELRKTPNVVFTNQGPFITSVGGGKEKKISHTQSDMTLACSCHGSALNTCDSMALNNGFLDVLRIPSFDESRGERLGGTGDSVRGFRLGDDCDGNPESLIAFQQPVSGSGNLNTVSSAIESAGLGQMQLAAILATETNQENTIKNMINSNEDCYQLQGIHRALSSMNLDSQPSTYWKTWSSESVKEPIYDNINKKNNFLSLNDADILNYIQQVQQIQGLQMKIEQLQLLQQNLQIQNVIAASSFAKTISDSDSPYSSQPSIKSYPDIMTSQAPFSPKFIGSPFFNDFSQSTAISFDSGVPESGFSSHKRFHSGNSDFLNMHQIVKNEGT